MSSPQPSNCKLEQLSSPLTQLSRRIKLKSRFSSPSPRPSKRIELDLDRLYLNLSLLHQNLRSFFSPEFPQLFPIKLAVFSTGTPAVFLATEKSVKTGKSGYRIADGDNLWI